MILVGAGLVLVGFLLVIPRGVMSGSASARNVRMGMQGVFQTPGYQRDEEWTRSPVRRIVTGLGMMAVGLLLIAFG